MSGQTPSRTAAAITRPSFDRITGALDAHAVANNRKPGPASYSGEWTKYRCPSHDDHDPSLGLIYVPEKHKTVVRCFTTCSDEEVLAAIGLDVRDLFDVPRRGMGPRTGQARQGDRVRDGGRERTASHGQASPVESKRDRLGKVTGARYQAGIYLYTDERGNPLGEVVRSHIPHEHGTEKVFRQRKCDAGGRWSGGGFAPVLYHLPAVRDAVAEGETIWLVEGEKDADRAQAAGLVATCNAMGAGSFKPEHAHQLRGAAQVVIVADKDEPGYRHAARVSQLLQGRVGELIVVEAATGKDLSDHVNCGHGLELDEFVRVDASVLSAALAGPAGGHIPAPQSYEHDHGQQPADREHAPEPESAGAPTITEVPSVSEHAADIDHAAREMAMFTRMMFQLLTEWSRAAALRRAEGAKIAARISAAEAELAEKRFEAEKKMATARLTDVGTEKWWKTASADDVLDAWYDATAWRHDAPEAERARQELVAGLRDRHGIDVEDLERGAEQGALDRLVTNSYSSGAALERAAMAQRFAINAVAEVTILDDDQRKHAYQAIDEYAKASARIMSDRRTSGPASREDEATRESARARVELLLASAKPADRDKVLFAMDYLTGDPRANIGEANWGASSDARAKVDEALIEYQRRLATGEDTTVVTRRLTELMPDLSKDDADKARQRGRDIKMAPAAPQTPLWPGAVHKDRLGEQIAEYSRLARSVDGQDQAKADAIELEIEKAVADKNSGLSPIERQQVKLTLSDAEQPGIASAPQTMWADQESRYRQQRSRDHKVAVERSREAAQQIGEVLEDAGLDPNSSQMEPVRHALVALRKECEAASLDGGKAEHRLNAMAAHRKALRDGLATAGVNGAIAEDVMAVAGQLETSSLRAATSSQRTKVKREAARGNPPSWDNQVRRAQLVEELTALGVDREQITALLLTDIAQARPAGAATEPGDAPKARSTASGAGMDLGKKRGRSR
ncbi:hypothetical protein ACQPXH_33080 (plasmid) [Nocardia sp. CA-135953]|uniref:hypothetical protein n=1 Tax=Nocardia sp. CA-135953 TaxID=3239978 RepID=UPI003D98DC2E